MARGCSVFDLPDTQENARVFGYSGEVRPGGANPSGVRPPKGARLVFLVEAGTHLFCDALISPYRRHERVQVRRCCARYSRHATDVGPGVALVPHGP